MRSIYRYSRTFSAAHQVLNDASGLCGPHRHGHTWQVTMEAEGTLDGYGGFPDPIAFEALVAELNGRDLNEMVRVTFPTAGGLAGWFLERLRHHIPGIRSVTVGIDGHSVTVEA